MHTDIRTHYIELSLPVIKNDTINITDGSISKYELFHIF